MSSFRLVSLFSGIGGFELGLADHGFEPILLCENDPLARIVLEQHFPGIPIRSDVRKMRSLPPCELLSAGWPCQDLSQAGRTSGIRGRHSSLVGEIFRLIDRSSRKPPFVLLENVAFALHLRRGEAIAHVVRELEKRGYAWAYRILDTREFGLPQRRRRIFVLASLETDPASLLFDAPCDTTPTNSVHSHVGFYWTEGNRGLGWTPDAIPPLKGGSGLSIPSPPAVWDVFNANFVTPGIGDAERLQGLPVGWTNVLDDVPRGRRCRWRLVGNAVSVPVVSWLASRIAGAYESVESQAAPQRVSARYGHNAANGRKGVQPEFSVFPVEGSRVRVLTRLSDFELLQPAPLSQRAASGFLSRFLKSPLRKNADFLRDLARYCDVSDATHFMSFDRAA